MSITRPAAALDMLAAAPTAREAHLQAWLDSLPGGTAVVDTRLRLAWAGGAFERLVGERISPGMPLVRWLALADDAARLLTQGDAVAGLPGLVLAADGQRRPVRLHAWPLPAPGPQRAFGLLVMPDTVPDETSVAHADELLAAACRHGRLGVWRRELGSLKPGELDDFPYWGLQRDDDAPCGDVFGPVLPEDTPTDSFAASIVACGAYATRYRLWQPDGSVRHLQMHWEVQPGADGRPARVVGVVRDETELHRLIRSLESTHAQMKLAVDLADIGVWRHDLRSDRVHYNDRGYAIFGLDPVHDGLDIHLVHSWLHPDDLPQVMASAERTLRTDEPTDIEARWRHRDGRWRWLMTRRALERDASGLPRAFLGVMLDVTPLREAMAELRHASERTQLIAHSVGLGTWEVDMRDGRTYWSDGMFLLRDLAPAPEPPPEAQRYALLHPDDARRVRRHYEQPIAGTGTLQTEFRVRTRDGGWRWLASRSTLTPAADGRSARRIGINWDVTQLKAAESARREKLVALRESQAKSQFLARMSHELRTPLNAVLGFAQLLLHDGERVDAASRRRRLEHIHAAGLHLLSLINDVLELSSVEGGEVPLRLEPVALQALVDDAFPLVEAMARERDVTLHRGALDAAVRADPTRLRQVLLNLLSNAIKYNRPGGTVLVEAVPLAASDDGADDDLPDAGAAGAPAARIGLRVIDSGRGMTPEQLQHVFEPFNRLGIEGQGIEGTGIGLAIVKALVDGMGGTIRLESEPGEGTMFEVGLEQAEPDEVPTSPAPLTDIAPAGEAKARRTARLVYIEDNPVNIMIVEELVARRGDLELLSAPDGLSGVQLVIDSLPALVLVDMQLPDIDGAEVLARLRADERTAHIPCIALSANAMPEDIEQALAAGFADYWTKPLDFRAFLGALDQLFGPAG